MLHWIGSQRLREKNFFNSSRVAQKCRIALRAEYDKLYGLTLVFYATDKRNFPFSHSWLKPRFEQEHNQTAKLRPLIGSEAVQAVGKDTKPNCIEQYSLTVGQSTVMIKNQTSVSTWSWAFAVFFFYFSFFFFSYSSRSVF